MFRKNNLSFLWMLLFILGVGGFFRFYAVSYGLGHHPDERHMVFVTERLSLKDLNPHSFAYGSLPFYLTWVVSEVAGYFYPFAKSYDGLFYSGRIICGLFGLMGVLLTYLLGRDLFKSPPAGLIAAALLALNFFHIQLSRYYTSDVILTTTCLLAIYGMVKIVEKNSFTAYLLTAIGMGLSWATKVSSLLLLPVFILALVYVLFKERQYGGKPLRTLLLFSLSLLMGALVGFIFEPYAVLDFKTFLAHTREQINMARGLWRPPYTVQYAGTLPYLYHLEQMFFYTLGWPVALTALAGLALALRRVFFSFRATEALLLCWMFLFFFATAGLQVKFPRYLLPLYPGLMLLAALPLWELVRLALNINLVGAGEARETRS